MLYKDDLLKLVNICEITPHWIAAKFMSGNKYLIIVAAYAKPKICLDVYMEMLTDSISTIRDENASPPIIVMGDFNARVGNKGEFLGRSQQNFSIRRRNLDVVSNSRGCTLLSSMKQLAFTLLNGRSRSDRAGEFTFIQKRLNAVVTTTIDLAFANCEALSFIEDFRLGEQFQSDHRMFSITVSTPGVLPLPSVQPKQIQPIKKTKWNGALIEEYQNAFQQSASDSHNPQSIYDELLRSIHAAAESTGMTSMVRNITVQPNQPWYDGLCKEANRKRRQLLRHCQTHDFPVDRTKHYVEEKKLCDTLFKQKKREHKQLIADRLGNCKNSIVFWSTVDSFTRTTQPPESITKPEWEKFYRDLEQLRELNNVFFTSVDTEDIIADFKAEELDLCLKKFKNGKAPGSDGITVEFFKCLPAYKKEELLKLFNSILHSETLPAEWSKIEMIMLHKKGPRSDPANYRGIALVQVICKIFTQLLLGRLEVWSDSNGILPEFQAGFRKSRGCIDHLYTLQTISFLQTEKRNQVYAAFIDYSRAFDSVNHNKLWSYLFEIGFPAKYLRIIRTLYEGASMHVRTKDGCTRDFQVTCGVLQGETFSPFLFSLFIRDMEEFINARVSRGVQLDQKTKIHLLAYADDVVLLGDSPGNLQQKLKAMEEYGEVKGLIVNIVETKIMIFNHGGRMQHRHLRFTYNGEQLGIVKSFTYLGLSLIPSGKMNTAVMELQSKANAATGATWKILVNSKLRNWDSRNRILEALSLSTLLYGSQIWGLEFYPEIERFNISLYKKLLTLPQATPAYLVRLECGLKPMQAILLKYTMTWLYKCMCMEAHRLPKLCLQALVKLDKTNPQNGGNWATQIRKILEEHGLRDVWSMDPKQISESINKAVERIVLKQRTNDIEAITGSRYNTLYRTIWNHEETAPYLTWDISLSKMRIIAQARLSGSPFLRFVLNGSLYRLEPKEQCPICNDEALDDLSHFLTSCKILQPLRIIDNDFSTSDTIRWLRIDTKAQAFKLYNFVTQALRTRSWCLGE